MNKTGYDYHVLSSCGELNVLLFYMSHGILHIQTFSLQREHFLGDLKARLYSKEYILVVGHMAKNIQIFPLSLPRF